MIAGYSFAGCLICHALVLPSCARALHTVANVNVMSCHALFREVVDMSRSSATLNLMEFGRIVIVIIYLLLLLLLLLLVVVVVVVVVVVAAAFVDVLKL